MAKKESKNGMKIVPLYDRVVLKVSDLPVSRLVVTDPAPIPAEELERTADWLKSWGMLEKTDAATALVNAEVQRYAHVAAE